MEIQKVPLKDKITSILMQRIIDGEIQVGDKLKEAHLAKAFGVSQAPVREAIITLVAKGILEHTPNVGTHVKVYTKDETIEIYQAREALELYSASFIHSIDTALLKEAYQKIYSAAKSNDIKQMVEHDQYFHELLLDGAKNHVIKKIWREQYTKSAVAHVIEEFSVPLEEIVLMHLPIIEAVEAQSEEQYTKAIKHHYRVITNNIKDKT